MSRRNLLPLCIACLWAFLAAPAAAAEPVKFKMEYRPEKKFEIDETASFHPGGSEVKEFVMYQVCPPATPRQEISLKAEPAGQDGFSEGAEKRPLVFIRKIFAKPVKDAELKYKILTTGTLCETFLTPLKEGEAPPAVAPLTAADRKRYTAHTEMCDYDSAEVKGWLDKAGLRRRRGELDLDFARRVFLSMRTTFKYNDPGDGHRSSGKASDTVHERVAVCMGLSHTFAAALRANGVPARCVDMMPIRICGTFSMEDMGTLAHLNNEVWIEGIGWVPLDVSSCVDQATDEEALDYFGHQHANFMVMAYEDSDKKALSVDTVNFGAADKGPPADFRSTFAATVPKTCPDDWAEDFTGTTNTGPIQRKRQYVIHTEPLVAERVDPNGEPPKQNQPVSFRVWKDDAGWHLRTRCGDKKTHKLHVAIAAPGGAIERYSLLSDGKNHGRSPRITMDFTTAADDGVDFQPAAGATTIRFDMVQDDAQPSFVFIGAKQTMPVQIPFLVSTSPVAATRSAGEGGLRVINPPTGESSAKPASPPAAESGALELQLATSLDKPDLIVCQATNPGKSPATIKPFGTGDNVVIVLLPDGSEMKLARVSDKITQIEPGKGLTWKVDLSGYEKLAKAGTYKVTWKCGSQSSNTLVLTRQ